MELFHKLSLSIPGATSCRLASGLLCRGVPGRGRLKTDICFTKCSGGNLLLTPFHIPHSPLSLGHLVPHHLFLVVSNVRPSLCVLWLKGTGSSMQWLGLAVAPSASYLLSILHSSRQCVWLCQTSTSKYCCRQRAAVCLTEGVTGRTGQFFFWNWKSWSGLVPLSSTQLTLEAFWMEMFPGKHACSFTLSTRSEYCDVRWLFLFSTHQCLYPAESLTSLTKTGFFNLYFSLFFIKRTVKITSAGFCPQLFTAHAVRLPKLYFLFASF